MTPEERTKRIRELNDEFRRTGEGGSLLMTAGVNQLDWDTRDSVFRAVREFDQFEAGNDPRGEHDFGAFEVAGERYFFKIDYYDEKSEFGSEDPSDPSKTMRVLTIMRADEY